MTEAIWQLAGKKSNLWKRQAIMEAVRRFFRDRDFWEVETPNRIPAPAPETHIDSFPSGNWFLHPSPELCMKRLLAAGYERIFQICKCYRVGERGTRHLPEFTLLEWYRAQADYTDLMRDCEELLFHVAREFGPGQQLTYQGQTIDLAPPWERITVNDAFRCYADISAEAALAADRFDEILVAQVEPHLGFTKPVFLYDYPLPLASLAQRSQTNPQVAERVELYICGIELANGFSELTDAAEQRLRFTADMQERRRLNKADYPLPEPFLEDLVRMPKAAGIALGLDRLVMILTDAAAIGSVVAFTPEML
ncbi:MAG: EF-P lysine aminoacylase GenX [Syntrophaceae bacterium]|nr:EF-P lysine aminoacylase GenX [Syntrophaceae bacterium]